MRLAQYAKAFMPLLVLAVLGVLAQAGVTSDMTVERAVSLLLTSGLVYLVPNKQ